METKHPWLNCLAREAQDDETVPETHPTNYRQQIKAQISAPGLPGFQEEFYKLKSTSASKSVKAKGVTVPFRKARASSSELDEGIFQRVTRSWDSRGREQQSKGSDKQTLCHHQNMRNR